jgi:hypothetical protein
MLYFFVLEARDLSERIAPALGASWRRRSFAPCVGLCHELGAAIRRFQERFHVLPQDMLLTQVARGLAFDRGVWRALAGEILLVSATEIPELETSPATLARLVDHRPLCMVRSEFSPIEQSHFGSRDLVFGTAYYRPEHAGWNDADDVKRLAGHLASLDSRQWTVADLAALEGLAEEERAEELAYVREWWAALVDLYGRAAEAGRVIICETP